MERPRRAASRRIYVCIRAPRRAAEWRAAAPLAVSFRLKAVFRLLAVTMAALQAWRGFSVNPDGVSYLDIADAYLRGDWHAAVSTYWSPLYSWLLAAGLAVFRPAPFAGIRRRQGRQFRHLPGGPGGLRVVRA